MFELRTETTLQLRFVFARLCDIFLLCYNCVIYLFNVVILFDNIRITLYFGKFELSLEITLQLRYVFAHDCDIILLCHNDVIHLFDVVTFFEDFRISLEYSTFDF